MKRIIQQPLLHFLFLGCLVFGVFNVFGQANDTANAHILTVDRAALLEFMQYRSKVFNSEIFNKKLDSLTAQERQLLIDDYLQEEVLYREAKALGMDRNDYVIRRRMIQKLEFIADNVSDDLLVVPDETLKKFYKTNQSNYYRETRLSFSHVYFPRNSNAPENNEQIVQGTLEELNRKHVNVADSKRYGERFIFFSNYVDQNAALITSHFGEQMTGELLALTSDAEQWQGPFESAYGTHLVLLIKRQDGFTPEFEDVRERVLSDYKRDSRDRHKRQFVKALLNTYDIHIANTLKTTEQSNPRVVRVATGAPNL